MKTCISYTNTYNFLAVLSQEITPDDEIHIVAFNYQQRELVLFLEICDKYIKPASRQLKGVSTYRSGVQPRLALIEFPITATSYADSMGCERVISDIISREPQAAKQMSDQFAQGANYLLNAEGGKSIEILSPLMFTSVAKARQLGKAHLARLVQEQITDPEEVKNEVSRLLGEEVADADINSL